MYKEREEMGKLSAPWPQSHIPRAQVNKWMARSKVGIFVWADKQHDEILMALHIREADVQVCARSIPCSHLPKPAKQTFIEKKIRKWDN